MDDLRKYVSHALPPLRDIDLLVVYRIDRRKKNPDLVFGSGSDTVTKRLD